MSAQRPALWQQQRVRVGLVVVLLLAALAPALIRQASSQTQIPAYAPHAAATFVGDKELLVGVTLRKANEPTSRVAVQLRDAEGKVLAEQGNPPRDVSGGYAFKLAADKAQAAKATLRIQLDRQHFDLPLGQILLKNGHETSLVCGQEFFAGTTAPFHCNVHGVRSARETVSMSGTVSVRLKDQQGKFHDLYSGRTGEDGQLDTVLNIPALPGGQYTLEVATRSPLGSEKLERAVRVKSDAKILLVSDRPIYQPGHLIHLRALALRPIDLKPVADSDLLFEVEDPKGNKVFKRALKTSGYGVASVDFQLADEVNMGDYHVRAFLGDQRAEKTVTVKRYVLPKFKVNVTSDKTFYLPKETVKAELQSDYFFGKPVEHGKIEVTASTFDVQFRQFHVWKGETDAAGHAKFEIKLPDYFVGTSLQKGDALVKLDVKLTDSADHTESVTKSYTVSDQPIRISLIPEGGKLAPGMENRIFAAANYPDGSPAVCDVAVWIGKDTNAKPLGRAKTNEAGLAEFKVTAKAEQFRAGNWGQRPMEMLGGQQVGWGPAVLLDMTAAAKDQKGNTARALISLNSQPLGENILLRLNKAVYQVGDTLDVEVRTSAGLPTAYVDIVRGGQIMLSRWLEVKNGEAHQKLDVPQNLFGTLEIHAYQMLASGEIIRDSRVVYVQPLNNLKIEVKADKSVYHPGEEGRIRFLVTDGAGDPAAAALGLIVVDEAVYALQDLQPGLEKVYFTLQEELLRPTAQVLYRPQEGLDTLVRQPQLAVPQQQAAQVLLGAVQPRPPARWQVAPDVERRNQFEIQVQQTGWGLYQYVWMNEGALQRDANTGHWHFQKDVLQTGAKSGFIYPYAVQARRGLNSREGLPSLEEIQQSEKDFDADHLANAITKHRMERLAKALVDYTGTKPANLKNVRWHLPPSVLINAARKAGLGDEWLRDGWGQAFKLVERDNTKVNRTGHDQFDHHDLISAGPDRDFETADDISWVRNATRLSGGWWNARHDDQLAQMANPYMYGMRYRGLGGRMELEDLRRAGLAVYANTATRALMRNADAAMPPMAAPAGGGFGGGGNMPAPAAALAERLPTSEAAVVKSQGAPAAEAPITKIREYFPETMLWQPALITDDHGVADLAVSFADSVTTWRLSASASSKGGALGGVTVPLKVFQDFFVDIDLPVTLTQHDEVAFPVAVYNYLKTPQTVTLDLQNESWFTLLDKDGLTRKLDLEPNQVTSVKFRVRADRIGFQPLTVKARGSKLSDAVKRVVEVVPDGEKIEKVITDRLHGKIAQTIEIPATALPDASSLLVRIYPGVMAQVIEGTEGMLHMPNGCFEQTSSSAYPNIMVVDYIKKARLASPQLLMKSEQYLNAGYQRLLTFERPGGGFDWWGSGEPLVWLSAYALQEFNDMAKVYPIDRAIIDRTRAWLMKQRDKDGTWANIGATHTETIASIGNPKLVLTSYVTWSLLEGGQPREMLKPSVDYIRTNVKDAGDNAYMLALAANALAAYDVKDDSTLTVLQRLEKLRKDLPDWRACVYPTQGQSLSYAHGDSVNVETTALAVLAMVRTGQFTNSVNKSLTYLVKAKGNGTWGSTQATILALKALVAGMTGSAQKGTTPFTVLVNGKEAARGSVTEENADVLQAFDLKRFVQPGENQVKIEVQGETSLMYQIVGRHYEPWKKVVQPSEKQGFDVRVDYDRTRLSTSDVLRAKATLTYHGRLPANMVMIDLGIAPGFTVDTGDFAEMVAKKEVNRFSVTSRQVILYLSDLRPGETRTFEYALRARFPLRAKAPAAVAWEYYTPDNRAESRPVELTVVEKK
jgi:hypothetical protein